MNEFEKLVKWVYEWCKNDEENYFSYNYELENFTFVIDNDIIILNQFGGDLRITLNKDGTYTLEVN